jgi:hypothetical protein
MCGRMGRAPITLASVANLAELTVPPLPLLSARMVSQFLAWQTTVNNATK